MNGPEHYAEAERLLGTVAPDQLVAGTLTAAVGRAALAIQAAAVHAQLAAVALTYDSRTHDQKAETRYGPQWKKATMSREPGGPLS